LRNCLKPGRANSKFRWRAVGDDASRTLLFVE